MSFIKIKNLEKAYYDGGKKQTVISALDFEINPGEIIVMFGRSGSGKSTLLNLLSGIDTADSGSITIDGIEVTTLKERDRTMFRRKNIGFVFQFFNLIPTLTVLENVMLPVELGGQSKSKEEKALELIEKVGLISKRDTFPDRLSGGEQQRVAIARAIIHDPPLVLADEPTGNLDFETGRSVIEVLDKFIRASGKTLLMATHSRELIGMADRIVSLREGVLHEISHGDVA